MYRIKIIESNSGKLRYVPQARGKFLWVISVWRNIDSDAEFSSVPRRCCSESDAQSCIDNFQYHREKKHGEKVKQVTYKLVTSTPKKD